MNQPVRIDFAENDVNSLKIFPNGAMLLDKETFRPTREKNHWVDVIGRIGWKALDAPNESEHLHPMLSCRSIGWKLLIAPNGSSWFH